MIHVDATFHLDFLSSGNINHIGKCLRDAPSPLCHSEHAIFHTLQDFQLVISGLPIV